MFNLFRTLRLSLKALSRMPDPKAVSLGVAVGLAVGLVPKDNLLAVAMGVLLCALRLSLVVGIGTAVGVSLVAHYADPVFDAVGGLLLENESLRPAWVWCARQPFSEWTQFNNTVTLGAFVCGLVAIYPVYRLVRRPADRYVPRVNDWVRQSRTFRAWGRMELAGRLSGEAS